MNFRVLLLMCCLTGSAAFASVGGAYQQKVFVSGTEASEIYVIDPASNTVVQTIKVDRPHGLAATKDGKWLWVASGWWESPNHAAVVKIDTVTGAIVESHSVPSDDELELANDDRDLYIAGFG